MVMKTLLTKKTSLYQIYRRVLAVSLCGVFILPHGNLTHWFWHLCYGVAITLAVCSLLSLPSAILYQRQRSWLARMGLIVSAMSGICFWIILLTIPDTFEWFSHGKSLGSALMFTMIALVVAIAHANVMQLLSSPSQPFLQAMIKLTLILIAVLAVLFLADIWVHYFSSREFSDRFSLFPIIHLVGGMNIVATLVTLFICSLRRKRKKRLKNH